MQAGQVGDRSNTIPDLVDIDLELRPELTESREVVQNGGRVGDSRLRTRLVKRRYQYQRNQRRQSKSSRYRENASAGVQDPHRVPSVVTSPSVLGLRIRPRDEATIRIIEVVSLEPQSAIDPDTAR